MRCALTGSTLFVVAMLTTLTAGQPPAPVPEVKKEETKAKENENTTAAIIAAALARDPDIMAAQARFKLAEAELAKARLGATQKALAAQAAVQDARLAVLEAEMHVRNLELVYQSEKIPFFQNRPDYKLAVEKFEAAKAKLATAEVHLKLLTGEAVEKDMSPEPDEKAYLIELLRKAREIKRMHEHAALPGPGPNRLRETLDKKVKLGDKDKEITFDMALEIFSKEAGLDVSVRRTVDIDSITSQGETLSVGAWLQMFEDISRGTFYVREYGLLYTDKRLAPANAPTLSEFWKFKPDTEKKD